METLKRFSRLKMSEQLWLICALLYLTFVSVALKRLPLRRTQRILARLSRLSPLSATSATLPLAIWAVRVASPFVPGGGNCFVRALVLQTLLAHRLILTQLYVGFASTPEQAKIEGHAWLEHGDRVLIGEIEDLTRFRANSQLYAFGKAC